MLWRASLVKEGSLVKVRESLVESTGNGTKFSHSIRKNDFRRYIRCRKNESFSCDGDSTINPYLWLWVFKQTAMKTLLQLLENRILACEKCAWSGHMSSNVYR